MKLEINKNSLEVLYRTSFSTMSPLHSSLKFIKQVSLSHAPAARISPLLSVSLHSLMPYFLSFGSYCLFAFFQIPKAFSCTHWAFGLSALLLGMLTPCTFEYMHQTCKDFSVLQLLNPQHIEQCPTLSRCTTYDY